MTIDFTITSEQRGMIDAVREFGSALTVHTGNGPTGSEFDRAGWQRCAAFGVHGWPVPVRFGGSELDPLSCVLAFEALGHACIDNGLIFAINNHVWACTSYVLNHGTAAQHDRFLPGLADGSIVGAHALTEPEAGSDILSMSTIVERAGNGYLLNGVKTFVSNAPVADLFVVFARDPRPGPAQKSISAFLVPRTTPGVHVARTWDKAGLRGCPMGEVRLENVRLPADLLLGADGAGYQVFTSTIEWERGFMFASQVGVLRRITEAVITYASTRRQFDTTIGSFQAISHKVADMFLRQELATLLLHKFGWLKQQGRLALLESSMLKLVVSESLVANATAAIQVHGARGYLTDFGIERELRDALATTIYAGTSEIHRSIIARLIGLGDGH